MLRKRKLEVKLVKDEEDDTSRSKPLDVDEITTQIAATAVVLIGAYMLADTVRKCVIHTVATKVV